jgi:AcrR family transcriptional regulator
MSAAVQLTPKGAATRARIIETAADLILAHGAGGTSLDDIRSATATSKSQLFHYFPGGKNDLIAAIAAFQGERVLRAQQPFLSALDTWEAWEAWRDAVIAHYGSQRRWGCPIGALASELSTSDPAHAAAATAYVDRWRGYLREGLHRMHAAGLLRTDADPDRLALATFASLQGGLVLTQTMRSIEPLRAALDGALTVLRAWAA